MEGLGIGPSVLPRPNFLDFSAIRHLDPQSPNVLGDQVPCNSPNVFPLHHDSVQLWIARIRFYSRRRRARRLQFLSETGCIEAESLKPRYTRDRVVMAANDVDRNSVQRIFPG